MEFPILYAPLVGVALMFVWAFCVVRRSQEANRATFAECDASMACILWLRENPQENISMHPVGRKLVHDWIDAHIWFSRMHPSIDFFEGRAMICTLLNRRS